MSKTEQIMFGLGDCKIDDHHFDFVNDCLSKMYSNWHTFR